MHEHVPNPLYMGIENSRRFRALPLFASLLSLGKEGYTGGSSELTMPSQAANDGKRHSTAKYSVCSANSALSRHFT